MPKIRLVDAKTWKAEKDQGDCGLVKTIVPEVIVPVSADIAKAMGATNPDRVLKFVVSDGGMDRDYDTVDPTGWDLKNYKKNPVVLWAHSYYSPPVAKSLKCAVEDDRLVSYDEFVPAEMDPFSDMVFQMYRGGFMRAVSAGFIPTEWKISEDQSRPYGYDILAQEKLEHSCVPIPANPRALIEANGKGINTLPLKTWAERVLDLEEPLRGITRTEVEKAWDAIATRAIVIDLKTDELPAEPPADPPADPAPAEGPTEEPPKDPTQEPEPTPEPVAASACPECSEPLDLVLPVDGAETEVRCICGAAWKMASLAVYDVTDCGDEPIEVIERSEDAADVIDFDDAALDAAIEQRMAPLFERRS